MVDLTVPGVKVQEISTLAPSIAPVDTAIPAFIGYTENAVVGPQKIESFLEFEQIFGGPERAEIDIDLGVAAEDLNQIVSISIKTGLHYHMYYSIRSFYDNGGGTCYVCSAGQYKGTSFVLDTDLVGVGSPLELISKVDEPTLLVFPDAHKMSGADLATKNTRLGSVYSAALSQCNDLKDRFTIVDTLLHSGLTPSQEIQSLRDLIGINNLTYGAAYYPRLESIYNRITSNSLINITGGSDDGTVGGPVFNNDLASILNGGPVSPNPFSESQFVDGILEAASVEAATEKITLAPSSTIAGIYAAVDFNRGVWKAPANVSLSGVQPIINVNDDLQSGMNVDPGAGKSINAIRTFAGKGTLVWGARTLAGNDAEWRYVNVRRLFIFIEESVGKAAAQFVFEPNSGQTWNRMKVMIENFLTNQWRQGALAGAKPEHAFFVRVGLGTTMTSDDINNGIMNIEIGLAPSRPAEFIVLKFSHKMQVA